MKTLPLSYLADVVAHARLALESAAMAEAEAAEAEAELEENSLFCLAST